MLKFWHILRFIEHLKHWQSISLTLMRQNSCSNVAYCKFPTLDVHTVTRRTATLQQCFKPGLNRARCGRGTWSLFSPAPWMLVASRFLGLARTNWSQTEPFENYCGVHFVARGSSSFSCFFPLLHVTNAKATLRCCDPLIVDWAAWAIQSSGGCWITQRRQKVEGWNYESETFWK